MEKVGVKVNHDAGHPNVPEGSLRQQQEHRHLVGRPHEIGRLFLRLPPVYGSQ